MVIYNCDPKVLINETATVQKLRAIINMEGPGYCKGEGEKEQRWK